MKIESKENKLNVYQKLAKVRAELTKLNLKKTGKNEYSRYTYYELGDFLPTINGLNNEHGLMTRFNIYPPKQGQQERAVLEIYNAEAPAEVITFISSTAEVEIGKKKDGSGGADPIQNLGGKITYMRRYMMMVAYEIVESDYVDQRGQNNTPQLDAQSIGKINAAKDMDELAQICKDIKAKKGPKYQKELIALYTARKGELETA